VATVDDTRTPGRRTRTRADTAVSPRRRKLRPNLGRVCVPADKPTKMRRAAGLGFSSRDQIRTDSDVCGSFASGRWRCPYALFSSGGVAFEDVGFLVLYCWCLCCCYKKLIIAAGLFFLANSFFSCMYP
jgi:hypothetical protein